MHTIMSQEFEPNLPTTPRRKKSYVNEGNNNYNMCEYPTHFVWM